MSEWAAQTFDEVVELQRGHDLPAGERNHGTVPIIGSFGITGYHDTARYPGPGVAIGRSGSSIGTATFVPDAYWPLNTCLFVKDFKGNDPRWVYWLLHQLNFEAFNSGSAQPSLNRNFLRSIPVAVPSRDEQRAIAEVLGALDDKIAANAAIAASADKMVRGFYDSMGGVTVRVDEVATSPRLNVDPSSVGSDSLYVGLEHVPRRHMWLNDAGMPTDVSSGKTRFAGRDVLFGKLRPYFHKVVSAPRDGICSTDILVVRAKSPGLSGVLLMALASDSTVEKVVAASEGTRMPRTSWRDLAAVEIKWPAAPIAAKIANQLDSLRDSAVAVLAENRTLAATRDALLPQLMSGRLRVRDAENIAADAGV